MTTSPILTKLISFESSHQMPPADTTFSLLAQLLDTKNVKIKSKIQFFQNNFGTTDFFQKKTWQVCQKQQNTTSVKVSDLFFYFSPIYSNFIFYASRFNLNIKFKKIKKTQPYRQAKIIKLIYTDREFNGGSDKHLFVIFREFLRKLCSNPLTKSGMLRESDNAHEPFEKLENRKVRTR